MFIFDRLRLRLFAPDGASGGEGAGDGGTTGVDAGTPGQEQNSSLEALGVPKDLTEKHRARKKSAAPAAQPAAETAAKASTEEPPAPAAKTPFSELIKDPDYNKELQRMMSQRVKDAGQARAQLEALTPALQALGAELGLDTSDMSKLDVDALTAAIKDREKSRAVKQMAADEGLDEVTAGKLYERDQLIKEAQQRQQQDLQQQQARAYFERVAREAEEMKAAYPNFDIRAELENPKFRQYTQQFGMSVKDAFHALHYAELQQARDAQFAKQYSEQFSNQVRSGSARPAERSSGHSSSAPTVGIPPVGSAERAALKARIQREGKVPFG